MAPSTSAILGLGIHLPERVLSNHDLEKMVETSDEWITTRTGIRERRVAAEGETTSDLALHASRKALDAAGIAASDLTHVLCATLSPDSQMPSTACVLANKLGLAGPMAMDVSAACAGFLYGLETARAIVALRPDAKVLLACSEVTTSRINWTDRSTCVLFGDGAGAAVVGNADPDTPGLKVEDIELYSDATAASALTILGGGSAMPYTLGQEVGEEFFIQMQGQEVFKGAVRSMTSACKTMLGRHGLGVNDVDLFISHQANLRIIDAVGKKLAMPAEKVFVNVDKYGNTSAASVPIALSEAMAQGRFKPGDLALIATFGGGFTWGSALIRA
jgi:3-oxoacyl-[acyl-carrier-protein] synthase-3